MINDIVDAYFNAPEDTKLYLGADSVRFEKGKEAFATISIVAVIHLGSKHGKVIGFNQIERVYDKNLGKPRHRMMLEVYEVSKLYTQLIEHIPSEDIEVHLDISEKLEHGSSCAAREAAGYFLGMHNKKPVMKPYAWAASTCADLYNKKLGASNGGKNK